MNFWLYSSISPSTICSSLLVPRVTVHIACVSPRLKTAEPCTRGRTPTAQEIGRMVSIVAAVGPNAGENRLARHLLFDFDKDRANLLLLFLRGHDLADSCAFGSVTRRGHLREQIGQESCLIASERSCLAGFAFHFANLVGDPGADRIDKPGIGHA